MSINYKTIALDDLRMHPQRVAALQNIRARAAALKAQYESIKTQTADAAPVQGGACGVEDRMVDNIVERERLKLNYRAVKPLVDIVTRGLAALPAQEQSVLMAFAQADRRDKGIADRLAAEMHMDRSTIYRILDTARYHFTISCYGVTDL